MTSASLEPRLLLFDLSRHLHLPSYLTCLIDYWNEHDPPGSLSIVVWHTFLRDHGDVVALAGRQKRQSIRFITPSEGERRRKLAIEAGPNTSIALPQLLKEGPRTAYGAAYDWKLFRRFAVKAGATAGIVVHLDHYLPLLAAGVGPPVPVSGIYFGPTFHYGDFSRRASRPENTVRRLRERFVLARALRQPALRTLFFLDPLAAERAQALDDGGKAVWLADPVRFVPPSAGAVRAWRATLGIPPDRKVLLLFGHLTHRKGIGHLLEAMPALAEEVASRTTFVFAGAASPNVEREIEAMVADVMTKRPGLQIVRRYGYVADEDVPAHFALADAVLAPYPDHAGMSGVLLLAAAAGRPVVSSEDGLLGEMVRRHRLGLAVDVHQPRSVAAALTRCVCEQASAWSDAASMRALADRHRPEQFARALLDLTRLHPIEDAGSADDRRGPPGTEDA